MNSNNNSLRGLLASLLLNVGFVRVASALDPLADSAEGTLSNPAAFSDGGGTYCNFQPLPSE